LQKALIIILLFIISGCSAKRMLVNRNGADQESSEEVIRRVGENNISNNGYNIEKANLSFKVNGETQKFMFSVKFNLPDRYLISVKSLTGIEGARIFITDDTLLINDRIGKRVMYGEPEEIEEKIGVSGKMIGIVFGDFFVSEKGFKGIPGNKEFNLVVNQKYGDMVIRSEISRDLGKVISYTVSSSARQRAIPGDSTIIRFSKFRRDKLKIPANIEINNKQRNISAKIRIDRITAPWDGEIEFIPGKGYKTERIK